MSLHGPESFYGVRNGFNVEKLNWANPPGLKQSRALIEEYGPNASKDCLNLTTKSLRTWVNYHLRRLEISTEEVEEEESDETSLHVLGRYPELVP